MGGGMMDAQALPSACEVCEIVELAAVGPPPGSLLRNYPDMDVWENADGVMNKVKNFCGLGDDFPGVPGRGARKYPKFLHWQACLADPIQQAW